MAGMLPNSMMQGAAYGRRMDDEGGESSMDDERAEGERPNVTPEEQAQYDDFMDKLLQVAYNAKFFPQVLDRIKGGSDPREGLASVTVAIVKRVADAAKQSGKPFSTDVVFNGGAELLEDLADTAGKAGVHDFSQDELEGALYRAMDIYREQGGDLSQDPNIQADFGQLMQADQAGALDQVVPGLAEKFGTGSEQPGAQPSLRGLMPRGMM